MSLESAIDRLAAAVESLAASNGGTTAAPTAPKAAKPAKAAKAAAPTPTPEPAPTPAAPAATGTDKKALTQKFIDLAKGKGRQVAAELLAKYGAADLPALLAQTDKYDEAAAAIDAALAS